MKTLKIKTSDFIDWYFNSGSDQEQESTLKSHARQYSGLIGQFFSPNGALTENGMYELVKVENGLLTDFVTVKFNQI